MKRISEFGIWKRLSSGGGGGEQLDVEKMKLQEENIWILANFSWRFKIPTDPLIWRVSAWRGTGGCPWCRWCVECRPRAASLASLTRSPSCRCPRLLAHRSPGRCPGWTVAPGWSFQHLGRPFENKKCRFEETVTSSPKHNDPVVVARLGRHLLCLQLLPRTKTLQCQFQIKVCIWIFVTQFCVLLQTLSAAPASAREQQITSSTTFLTLPTWKHSQVKTEALCKFNRCGNDDSVLPVTCIMEILACALICISLGILYELYEWMNEFQVNTPLNQKPQGFLLNIQLLCKMHRLFKRPEWHIFKEHANISTGLHPTNFVSLKPTINRVCVTIEGWVLTWLLSLWSHAYQRLPSKDQWLVRNRTRGVKAIINGARRACMLPMLSP